MQVGPCHGPQKGDGCSLTTDIVHKKKGALRLGWEGYDISSWLSLFRKDICLFLAGSRMELLLELHCVKNEGCFYMLLLELREDMWIPWPTLTLFYFFACSITVAFKFRVISGEGGLRIGTENL